MAFLYTYIPFKIRVLFLAINADPVKILDW